MARLPKKSCYVVELSVGPGGSRWAELHAYSQPAHVRWVIEQFCKNPGGMSAYHAIWYGAVLGVWTIQGGEVTVFLDLHPLLRAGLDGKPTVALDDNKGCLRLVREGRPEVDEDEDEESDDEDYDDADFDTYERMVLTFDWKVIAARLPALEPPLLAPGEQTTTVRAKKAGLPKGTYLQLERSVSFGSRDVECGNDLPGPS